MRNDVLGGDPAGEAAIETGRRWALDEPVIRSSCKINVFSPGNAGGGRAGGAVPPSACQLPVRKVPGWCALGFPPGLRDAPYRTARRGANSGIGGRAGDSTVVARPRLLVTVRRVCVEAVILCGGLTLALGLSPRVTTAAAIFAHGIFCLSARIYPLDGNGSFVLANADTPHRRPRVVRGLGSNSRSC